ncbi:RNA polymerase sigma factor [Pedobacter sp. AW31-3R]|uniref:RNA polymerase sigma factor n=1 Tax=Pedobacter sp. AW31-3R TaxID=3445781 RepID=UPI003FA14E98
MNLATLSDTGLIDKVKNNHTSAFEEIFKRYWEPLYVFAFKKLKDEDDAKDVVQNVFINFWQRSATLEITDTLEKYLFSAVRYELLHKISQSIKQQKKITHYYNEVIPNFMAALDPLQQKELMAAIEQQIAALPDRLKEIYRLSKEENLSIKEIAMRLNISEQTVKNQLSTALKKLRVGLKEAFILILISSTS